MSRLNLRIEEEKHREFDNIILNARNLSKTLTKTKQLQKLTKHKHESHFLGIPPLNIVEIKKLFNDITFLVLCGPKERAKVITQTLVDNVSKLKNCEIATIGNSDFFMIYKLSNILICSHGMGSSSVGIFLNELLGFFKIINRLSKISMIRVGSSGGIGVEGGTIVISNGVHDPVSFQNQWTYYSCGKEYKESTILDKNMIIRLNHICKNKKYKHTLGGTVSCDTYYEGQGRLDGSICEYNDHIKMEYLKRLYKSGIRNFEMEGVTIAGMCARNNIPFAMIAVSYLDRLKLDTVSSKYSKKEIGSWMTHCIDVIVTYVSIYEANSKKN